MGGRLLQQARTQAAIIDQQMRFGGRIDMSPDKGYVTMAGNAANHGSVVTRRTPVMHWKAAPSSTTATAVEDGQNTDRAGSCRNDWRDASESAVAADLK